MGAKAQRRLGLEISNSAVRMADITVGSGRPKLVNIGMVRLPPRTVVDGTIVDLTAVANAIERCVKEGEFASKEVHLSVAGLRAITRELDMPQVPDSELDSAVRLQALDVIPFPVERTLLSARPLGTETDEDGAATRHVLVAAAHRDLVDPLIAVVEQAGLTPLSVELSSLAMVRALYDPASPNGVPEAIVSIGSGLTTIVIHEDGVPHFVRTVAEGGDSITAAISGALDLPLDDAESTKRNLEQTGPHIRAAAAAAQQATSSLISEIKSSVEYYSSLPGRGEVRRLKLTGGGSRMAGFTERLQMQVRCDVVEGSALTRVDTSELNQSPEDMQRRDALLATVVGLALPEPPGVKPLDLLPPEISQARREKHTEKRVLAVAAAIVVILLGLGVLKFLQVHKAENAVGSQRSQIAALDVQIASKDKAAKEFADIKQAEVAVAPALAEDVNWPTILDDLAAETPGGGTVTSFAGSYSPPVGSSTAAIPPEDTVIATVSINVYSDSGFPYFRTWMREFETSGQFRVVETSGVSHPSGKEITFTAELDVLGTIQSSRISEFEVKPK